MTLFGSLISTGGGVSSGVGGGGGGGSITAVNTATGPIVTIDGANGIELINNGNTLTVDVAPLSGFLPQTSGVASLNGVREHATLIGQGSIDINVGNPNIFVSGRRSIGVNGVDITQNIDGDYVIDGSLLSGVNTINNLRNSNISLSGINITVIPQYPTLDQITMSGAINGVTSLNNQEGDMNIFASGTARAFTLGTNIVVSGLDIVGVNGINVSLDSSTLRSVIDGAAISGVNAINSIRSQDITISGTNGINVTNNVGNSTILIEGVPNSGICFNDTFSAITSGNFVHNFASDNLIVQVRDEHGQIIEPAIVQQQDINSVDVVFTSATTGEINIIGCPSGTFVIRDSDVDCYTETFTSTGSGQFSHNLNTRAVLVQVQDEGGLKVDPDEVFIEDENTVSVTFVPDAAGRVTIMACGGDSNGITNINGNNGPSITLEAVSGVAIVPTTSGLIISGENGLRKAAQTFTSSLTWTLVHNFNTSDVIVQATDNSNQFITPATIDKSSLSQVVVTFNTNQAGRLVVIG